MINHNRLICHIFASLMLLIASVTAAYAGAQDFTLVNKTGVVIHYVYISPSNSDDWEEDILGVDTLASGESVNITFSRNEAAEYWDIMVEDSRGNSLQWTGLNLLEISKVTLFYRNGRATAEYE